MTKNIRSMDRDMEPAYEIVLNGNPIAHYIDDLDLPEGEKRKLCAQHFNEGIAEAARDDIALHKLLHSSEQ